MAGRKMGLIWMLLCMCICLIPYGVHAVSTSEATETISIEKKCDLTLSYTYEGKAIENANAKLYQIAEVSSDMQYTLAIPFQETQININGIQSNEEWDLATSTLESHIIANSIETDLLDSTNQSGQADFKGLVPGLYLLISDPVTQGNQQYEFKATLIALPGLDENGVWQYKITAAPKPAAAPPINPDDKTIEYKVVKLWKDDGKETKRPRSIEVELFQDGKSFKNVTLSEENNWAYSWSAPADSTNWMVTEKSVPEGYIVTVDKRTTTFVLTNSIVKDKPASDELPKTGDTSNIFIYVLMMFITGSVLIMLGTTGKRERS